MIHSGRHFDVTRLAWPCAGALRKTLQLEHVRQHLRHRGVQRARNFAADLDVFVKRARQWRRLELRHTVSRAPAP